MSALYFNSKKGFYYLFPCLQIFRRYLSVLSNEHDQKNNVWFLSIFCNELFKQANLIGVATKATFNKLIFYSNWVEKGNKDRGVVVE